MANPSMEHTSYSRLRRLRAAAHLKTANSAFNSIMAKLTTGTVVVLFWAGICSV